MRRNLFVIAAALAMVVGAVMVFTGFGFAQANGSDDGGYSYGESSEGADPDLENRYGPGAGSQEEVADVATDDGGYGEPGEGEGPDMEHRYGPGTGSQEEAAEVTTDDGDCLGAGPAEPQGLGHGYSHGESSEGAGPGLENHWGWPDD